jgi:peptide/nickel transport system substrate-binding protein
MARYALVALTLVVTACFERGGDQRPPAEPVAATAIDAATKAPVAPRDERFPPDIDGAATIVWALEAEPAHLNPLLGGDAITNRVALGDIYEGLLCGGTLDEPEPCLADTVKVNDAATVWTFTLRADVAWHDGVPVTIDDVEFTLGLLTGPNPAPSYLAAEVDDFVSFSRAGERSFTIAFSGFRVGRRGLFVRMPILPKHVFDGVPATALATSPGNHAPVGTGPLRFVSWNRGESIELERNDAYWGAPARARRISHRVFNDRQRAIRAIGAGDIDVIVQLPVARAISAAKDDSDIGTFSYGAPSYLAAVYNLRHPQLAKVEVRQALAMLMDVESLDRELFYEAAGAITGPFIDRGSMDSGLEPIAFDPKSAGAALRDRATLSVLVPAGSRTMGRIADIWASDARAHVTLKIVEVPFADMLGRMRAGDFDIAMMAFTTSRDVDLYTRFHSSQVGAENYGAVRDAELDRLLEAVRAEPRTLERQRLEQKLHRRIFEVQPYTFILADSRMGLVRLDVGGTSGISGVPSAWSLWRERR